METTSWPKIHQC